MEKINSMMEEEKWQNKFNKDQLMQDGYRTQQATKPQTLSYGMMDSPVGVAAWILEKMYFWSDLKNNDIENIEPLIFRTDKLKSLGLHLKYNRDLEEIDNLIKFCKKSLKIQHV